jgi:hypothetical protein
MSNVRRKAPRRTERAQTEVEKLRESLKDHLIQMDITRLPPALRPKAGRPDRDALFRLLPRLDPPLSTTIIEERREHD